MEPVGIIAGLAVLLYFIAGPGLGIAGYRRAKRNDDLLLTLAARLESARHDIQALTRAVHELQEHHAVAPPPAAAPPATTPAAARAVQIAAAPAALPSETRTPSPWAALAAAPEDVEPAFDGAIFQAALPQTPRLPAPAPESLEQALTSRWMLWLGAVTLALAGAFLVKYAIDEGWLGPAARVSIGFLAGCGLTAWGEWLRRRPMQRAIATIRPNYLPPSLSAAGVWIAFASVYAASELYNLLPPLAGFGLLGAISAGAVLLALPQGPFLALLGIIGGYATPLLVPSDQPLAWGLFSYLLFIAATAFVVVRFTAAWWLAQLALAGAAAWALLWFAAFWHPADAAPLGIFMLALTVLTLLVPRREPFAAMPSTLETVLAGFPDARSTIWIASAACAVMVYVLVRMDNFDVTSLATFALFALLCLGAGFRWPPLDGLPVLAAGLTVFTFATWSVPDIADPGAGWPFRAPPQSEALPGSYAPIPLASPGALYFLMAAAGLAVLLGGGCFAALWRARRPALWASASAATPVLLLVLAYWQTEDFHVSFSWAAVALAIAALGVAAAAAAERRRADPGFTLALAAYAAAATTALSLGAAMALQQAWLTVALSVELPVLAWIGLRLKINELRPVVCAVAAVVLVRLLANASIVDYPLGTLPVLNWVLYGYGVPAAAFLLAARWLRRTADGRAVMLLEAGALLFAALLLTLEIHTLFGQPLYQAQRGLLEQSLHANVWLAIAIGLATTPRWAARSVAIWGGRLLAGTATLQVLFGHVLANSPLLVREPVGDVPLLNLLLLAYGLPAALLLVYARVALRGTGFRRAAQAIAAALLLLDVSLEVRHAFQGAYLEIGRTSAAEWYAYSAIWLGYAGVLLAGGISTGSNGLRYGSLAVLLLTVAKVFLSDMSSLTGLLRAASFAGLGLCLLGVGYLYQRFVFPAVARPVTGAGPQSRK